MHSSPQSLKPPILRLAASVDPDSLQLSQRHGVPAYVTSIAPVTAAPAAASADAGAAGAAQAAADDNAAAPSGRVRGRGVERPPTSSACKRRSDLHDWMEWGGGAVHQCWLRQGGHAVVSPRWRLMLALRLILEICVESKIAVEFDNEDGCANWID